MTSVDTDPDSTRERCLEQAFALLRDGGGEAVSLRAVARGAKLSATAPYRHFPSKEAMLAVLAARGFGLFEGKLRAAVPQGIHLMTMASFVDMGVAYVRFSQEQPEYYRLMFGGLVPDHTQHPELDQAGSSAFSVLLQAIEVLQRMEQIRPGNPRQLAAHVWSVCHGFSSLLMARKFSRVEGFGDWEQEFRAHQGLLMQGLAP